MAFDEELLYRLVGERIRAAREQLKPRLSQAQLAAKLGISRASVVNIEAGRQRAPVHVLWQIADFLRTELRYLVPSQAEYIESGEPVELDEQTIAQISAAANGDATTRAQLTSFIRRVKAQKT